MSKDSSEASRAFDKLIRQNASKDESNVMLFEDQAPSQKSLMLSQSNAGKSSLMEASTRQLSIAAEHKLASIPQLVETLRSLAEQKIIQPDPIDELPIPMIDETSYQERTYMQRSVVKPQELDLIQGGDRIDFLSKPTTYAGSTKHISGKGPIFLKQ